MDKLKPIIRHHFWILFVVALVLPPIAWSMTTGALNEQTQTRIDGLNSTLGGVAQGTGSPNADWTAAANQLVNVRKESNRRAWSRLWDVQEALQLWPGTVRPYMEKLPYRGTPTDLPDITPDAAARLTSTVPNLFRLAYNDEVKRVWQIPEPIDEQAGLRAEPDALQKVLFPSTVIPRVPQAKWMAAQPTWKEMWNAQEDLWLMSELLKAIKRTNADGTSIADANVRQIRLIQLFGGERAAAGSSASGSGGSLGSSESMMTGYSGMPGGASRGSVASGGPAPADFSLAEEYTVKDAPAGGAGAFGSGMGMPMDGSGGGASSGDSGADPQADENRYIKQEWAYRTRGFKLQLTVHQMYLPTLYSELLKSQFPVEIVRMQQSALNPDRPGNNRSGGLSGGNFAATGGGYPGMSGGYPGGAPGSGGGYPGESESYPGSGDSGFTTGEGSGSEGSGYNPYGELAGGAPGASGPAAATNAVNSAVVSAALTDINLMDIVIVGEIYLYNQPEVAEGEAAVEADPAAGVDLAADPGVVSPAAGLPEVVADPVGAADTGFNTAPVVQPGAVPAAASPAALTGEVAAPAGDSPVTLEPNVLPADPAVEGAAPQTAPGVPEGAALPDNAVPPAGGTAPPAATAPATDNPQ